MSVGCSVDFGAATFIVTGAGWLSLGGSVLAKDLTGPALGYVELSFHLLHTGAAASGA